MKISRYLVAAVLSFIFMDLAAQSRVDTAYIGKYSRPWRVMLTYNASEYTTISSGKGFSSVLSTSITNRFSVGLGYQGLGFNYSYRPGSEDQTEVGIQAYGRALGAEFKFHTSHNLTMDIKGDGGHVRMSITDLRMSSILMNGYWALNPRKFSYQAALIQSRRQKRSAGSPILGWALNIDDIAFIDTVGYEKGDLLSYSNVQLLAGAGYGYNWVLDKGRLLVHASLIPMFPIVDSYVYIYKDAESEVEYPKRFSITGLARAGIFYYWSDRFYTGLILTDNLCGGWEDGYVDWGNSWFLRLPVVYRF